MCWKNFIYAQTYKNWNNNCGNKIHTNPYPYLNPIWVPDTFPSVDPLKQVMTDLIEVRAGFDSRSNKQAKRGRDPEVVSLEIERDNQAADDKGFVLDSDPRRTAKSGAVQQVESASIQNTVNDDGRQPTTSDED